MTITPLKIAYHRNGICGNGFYVVLFTWTDPDARKNRTMLATVFEEPGSVAVLDVDATAQRNIAFAAGNSWRGDDFEPALRHVIDQHNIALDRQFLREHAQGTV